MSNLTKIVNEFNKINKSTFNLSNNDILSKVSDFDNMIEFIKNIHDLKEQEKNNTLKIIESYFKNKNNMDDIEDIPDETHKKIDNLLDNYKKIFNLLTYFINVIINNKIDTAVKSILSNYNIILKNLNINKLINEDSIINKKNKDTIIKKTLNDLNISLVVIENSDSDNIDTLINHIDFIIENSYDSISDLIDNLNKMLEVNYYNIVDIILENKDLKDKKFENKKLIEELINNNFDKDLSSLQKKINETIIINIDKLKNISNSVNNLIKSNILENINISNSYIDNELASRFMNILIDIIISVSFKKPEEMIIKINKNYDEYIINYDNLLKLINLEEINEDKIKEIIKLERELYEKLKLINISSQNLNYTMKIFESLEISARKFLNIDNILISLKISNNILDKKSLLRLSINSINSVLELKKLLRYIYIYYIIYSKFNKLLNYLFSENSL